MLTPMLTRWDFQLVNGIFQPTPINQAIILVEPLMVQVYFAEQSSVVLETNQSVLIFLFLKHEARSCRDLKSGSFWNRLAKPLSEDWSTQLWLLIGGTRHFQHRSIYFWICNTGDTDVHPLAQWSRILKPVSLESRYLFGHYLKFYLKGTDKRGLCLKIF